MRVVIETSPLGIEDKILRWSKADRRTLQQAANLLGEARTEAGENTDHGDELGKAEMWVREYTNDFVLRTRTVPIVL